MTKLDPSAAPPAPSSPSASIGWDEARLASALSRLQATHIQLRNLRTTVPSLVLPLRSDLSSPELVYAEFAKAATGAVNNVRDFAVAVRDPALQEILEHVKARQEHDPEGIMGWLAAQHDDWAEREVTAGVKSEGTAYLVKIEDLDDGERVAKADRESESTREDVLEGFKSRHGNLEIVADGDGDIKVSIPRPASLTFRIAAAAEAGGKKTIHNVSCEETGKPGKQARLHSGVMQAFARRSKPEDLHNTLEMIAAYWNLKTQSCQKCHKLTDREGQFPVVRASKPPTGANSLSSNQWEALHFGCAPP